LFSGLVEPIGALIAALFLTPMNYPCGKPRGIQKPQRKISRGKPRGMYPTRFKSLIPASLAFAAGVMVFITLDELVPAAREFGHQHTTAIGIIAGAISVFLLSGLLGV
jgi:zinc transporter ZupT